MHAKLVAEKMGIPRRRVFRNGKKNIRYGEIPGRCWREVKYRKAKCLVYEGGPGSIGREGYPFVY